MGGRGGGGNARRVVGELTPLHAAAKPGHEAVLRALVAGGADPLLKAQGDTSLLMAAASSGSPAIVKLVFAEMDRRVDAVSDTGATVLHAALMGTLATSTADEIFEVVRFLADNGAPLDQKDATGRTPLQIAGRQPLEKVTRLLTERVAKSKPQGQL
jgi:ankyrin repeat protein